MYQRVILLFSRNLVQNVKFFFSHPSMSSQKNAARGSAMETPRTWAAMSHCIRRIWRAFLRKGAPQYTNQSLNLRHTERNDKTSRGDATAKRIAFRQKQRAKHVDLPRNTRQCGSEKTGRGFSGYHNAPTLPRGGLSWEREFCDNATTVTGDK